MSKKRKRKRMSLSTRRQIVLLLFLLIVVSVLIIWLVRWRAENTTTQHRSNNNPLITRNGEEDTEADYSVPEVKFIHPAKITDAEAEKIFRDANDFYMTWIYYGPKLDDGKGYEKRLVNKIYLPVVEEGFTSIEAILRTSAVYFGQGTFDQRIEALYFEKNGKLYAKLPKELLPEEPEEPEEDEDDWDDDEDEETVSEAAESANENWHTPDEDRAEVVQYNFRITERENNAVNFRVRLYTDEELENYAVVTNHMRLTMGMPPFDESFNGIYGYAGAGLHGEDEDVPIEVYSEPEPETEESTEDAEADED